LVVPLRDDVGAPWLPAKTSPRPGEIGLDGFEHRALPTLRDNGKYVNLAAAKDGRLLFSFTGADGTSAIKLLDLKKERTAKDRLKDTGDFKLSASGEKLLVRQADSFAVVDAAPDQKIDKSIVLGAMTVDVDPRAERRQVFDDAWRFYRDYLFDGTMRGVDWPAVRARYAKLLDFCGNGEDLYQVIREMVGELGVSHAFVWLPDRGGPPPEDTGMLAVDFRGRTTAPTASRRSTRAPRRPLGAQLPASLRRQRPGGRLSPGRQRHVARHQARSLDGLQGSRRKDREAHGEHEAGQGCQARDVTVAFSGGENYLRSKAWAEANRATVDRRSQGRIGYMYLADTYDYGSGEFSRQLNPSSTRTLSSSMHAGTRAGTFRSTSSTS
jgi:tricorn protease